tara:strand:- start:1477 stop:1899 length:423 start_codon:yes stop_codon:yes gene_type:complete
MKTLKQIQEENRKFIIMANNPTAKTYDEALEMEENICMLNTVFYQGNSVYREYIHPCNVYKNIGKPLTLSRVLIALKGRWSGFFVDNIFLPSKNNSAYAKINLLNTGDEIISLNWDLTKETLEEQSEETQRKFNELINEI